MIWAQSSPGSSSSSSTTLCDGYGSSSTYTETIDSSGSVSKRTITAAGCPNHYSICTGKSGTSGYGGLGEAGTATEAVVQDHSLNLPASPVLRDSWGVDVTASSVQCSTDAVGVALNGVTILTGAVGGDDCTTFVDVDDITSEWISFDCCSGHTRSFEGQRIMIISHRVASSNKLVIYPTVIRHKLDGHMMGFQSMDRKVLVELI